MRVFFLSLGYMELDKNWMTACSSVGTKSNPHVQNCWYRIPVEAVLIDHPDGKILFDTGCNFNAMNGHWPEGLCEANPFYYAPEEEITNQLALCGTKPEEIKTVVLSHMHQDHAGNLHLFKDANVIVHRKEFVHALTTVHQTTDAGTYGCYIKADVDVPVKKFDLIDDDEVIAEGVTAVCLPGHTPGTIGLLLHLEKEGYVLLPSDACYSAENYGPPAKASGLTYDSLSYNASMERIRKLQKQYNAKVIFSHDQEFYDSLKKAPEYYE